MNDSLMSFLTSSMNIELVHVILKSISTRTSGSAPANLEKKLIYPSYKYTEKHTITLDSIKIKDADQWAVVKLPDLVQHDEQEEENSTKKSGYLKRKTTLGDRTQTVLDRNKFTIINEDIVVEEYAPDVFAHLRAMDGIDKNLIKSSLSPKFNRDMVFKAGESQGKSGSFFFFSHDKNFIIKTMTPNDYGAFCALFEKYHDHVQRHKMSMLARIYGVFTVTMEDIEAVHLVLMGNTKQSNDSNIEHVFDLKGSMVNREVRNAHKLKNTTTLKDKNLLGLCRDKTILRFRMQDKDKILKVMEADIEFLRSFSIMDYSLLLAIEKNPNFRGTQKTVQTEDDDLDLDEVDNEEFADERHKYASEGGRYFYHLGVIDYLQEFNFEKKGENFLKMLINRPDA